MVVRSILLQSRVAASHFLNPPFLFGISSACPDAGRAEGTRFFGAGTEILDESNTSGTITNEYVFFGGKRVAMRNVTSGTIYYYEEDMLGSSRTQRGLPGRRLVEPGGSVQAGQTAVCYDADFYPFGGERDITNTCTQHYKFEGKERDTETGNDDFGARYYTSRLGRWLSADWSSVPAPVPYANLTNPQTLNLYAMVSDNPETFADLDGHTCGTLDGSETVGCASPANSALPGEGFASPNGAGTQNSTTQGAQGANAKEQADEQHAAQRKNPEQLKYKTVLGNQHTNPWEIKWSLTHNTKKGGWIVQHIVADFKGAGHYDYWEAWPVAAGSHVPSIQGTDPNGNSYSDMFQGGAGSHIHASASFYEGLALPDSFSVQAGLPSGALRATIANPNLPTDNATVPNVRWWGVP